MAPIAPSGTPIVVGRFKKPEAMFTGGPEHAISYTWQLASNVAIIYPDRWDEKVDPESSGIKLAVIDALRGAIPKDGGRP